MIDYRHYFLPNYPVSTLRNTLWLLLVAISVIGLFYPYLGWFVPIMMISLLILSLFRPRYWCGNICPRGSFFDAVLNRVLPTRPVPRFMYKSWFRYSILVVFFSVFGFRLMGVLQSDAVLEQLGFLFVTLCLFTTVIGLVLAPFFSHRTWCVFCPMGTMQGVVSRLRPQKTQNITLDPDKCIQCAGCSRVCPMQLEPFRIARNNAGNVDHPSCIQCRQCIEACPMEALHYSEPIHVHVPAEEELTATVIRSQRVGDATELTMEVEEDLAYKPGQYILIKVSEEPLVYRAYSIVSYGNRRLSIAIKPLKKGLASRELANLSEGAQLTITQPKGTFTPQKHDKIYFFAAGMGITPIMPMVKETLANGSEVTLMHSAQTRHTLYYHEKLHRLQHERFTYIPTLTRESDPSFQRGRITALLQDRDIDPQAAAYICGSPSMVEQTKKALQKKGIPEERIFSEAF